MPAFIQPLLGPLHDRLVCPNTLNVSGNWAITEFSFASLSKRVDRYKWIIM